VDVSSSDRRSSIARAKGKFFGQEIELSESLAKPEKSATAAQSEAGRLPSPSDQHAERHNTQERREEASAIERVLTMAAQSPKAALLLLASELEREVRGVTPVAADNAAGVS